MLEKGVALQRRVICQLLLRPHGVSSCIFVFSSAEAPESRTPNSLHIHGSRLPVEQPSTSPSSKRMSWLLILLRYRPSTYLTCTDRSEHIWCCEVHDLWSAVPTFIAGGDLRFMTHALIPHPKSWKHRSAAAVALA